MDAPGGDLRLREREPQGLGITLVVKRAAGSPGQNTRLLVTCECRPRPMVDEAGGATSRNARQDMFRHADSGQNGLATRIWFAEGFQGSACIGSLWCEEGS